MTRIALIVLLLFGLATGAAANLLLRGVSAPATGGGTPTPPAGCDGTIDLSTGCVQPMLR